MIQPSDRKSYYITVVAVYTLDISGEASLYAIGARLIKRLSRLHISSDLFLTHGIYQYICLFEKLLFLYTACICSFLKRLQTTLPKDRHAGINLMGSPLKKLYHLERFRLISRLSKNPVVYSNYCIRADQDTLLLLFLCQLIPYGQCLPL